MAENMDATGSGEQQEKRGMSRRTVLAGAAWSVPVIAVASAAPAMAASPTVILEGFGLACKHPGQSTDDPFTYHFTLVFTNTGGTTSTVTITDVYVDPNAAGPNIGPAVLPPPFDVPGNGSAESGYIHTVPSTNSSNGTLYVEYTYTTPTGTGTFTDTLQVRGLNPCPRDTP